MHENDRGLTPEVLEKALTAGVPPVVIKDWKDEAHVFKTPLR